MKLEDKEQYLKRGTLAVLGVLRDLEKHQTPVRVTCSRGQFISRLLFVDKEQVVVDYGSSQYDNQLASESEDLQISAETHGAKVEFTLPSLNTIEHEGLPAFAAPLPDMLWMLQRREFFRVNAPLEPVFFCETKWPDGSKARFRLQDLSLGGIGVLVDGALPEKLNSGDIVRNLYVELGEYGQFTVDTQLLNIAERTTVSSKNETVVTPRLSFRFVALTAVQERQLQQVIFALERLARDKAMRFQ
ncbi:flagellar brake protein [Erwiniaceae bacterium BAC15a-03b]|uniref:Flagellar brake protein YcgR n=1 Tax=Winslowiella arboricola TaxID=2978220 RepID=A0A9J6PRJ9_9GAMM|nr:flagellar brake protein [Winslowiella arboricola]MCU5774774.1 flagellar brake protein [Winslowiella arboricola]MCU5780074.1 flagellar brake protein [Winslowiella arboricola]